MLWEIARFEIGYQTRRPATWVYFVVLCTLTLYGSAELSSEYARMDDSYSNGPFIVAALTLLCGTFGLIVAAAFAGDAAARDVQTGMAPLIRTSPVGTLSHLGGRFLAAFGLALMLLLAVPLGLLLVEFLSGSTSDLTGPFRPGAHAGAFMLLLLPNAFVATAMMFSLAALARRAIAGYLGGVLLLGACAFGWGYLARASGHWQLGTLMDPFGAAALDEMSMVWTASEKSSRTITLDGALLANRLLWMSAAVATLTMTFLRLRHRVDAPDAAARSNDRAELDISAAHVSIALPQDQRRTFGFSTRMHQTMAIAGDAFRASVRGWPGLLLPGMAAFLVFSGLPIAHMGVPIVATAERITAFLAAPFASPQEVNGIAVPLLIAYYAGELVWRDRDARLHAIADAAPTPEWVLCFGKFLALALILAAMQTCVLAAGIATQIYLGHRDVEIGLYGQTLFGLQLPDWLLFSLLALVVHALVNHKYLGHLLVIVAYSFVAFAPAFGIEHRLLIYGSDPGWTYSDMRGFEPFVGPWLWFKLYWTGWALLLGVLTTIFWVRGTTHGLRARLHVAIGRVTPPVVRFATAGVAVVLSTGAFIFYNTNIVNAYRSSADSLARRAEYEHRYGRFKRMAQPQITAARLQVELYPERRAAGIEGAFTLVNRTMAPIETILVATPMAGQLSSLELDGPATLVPGEERFGHVVYALKRPLQPGESLGAQFRVSVEPRSLRHGSPDPSIAANGTHATQAAWLPAIGYQADRELRNAADRRAHGLDPRPPVTPLDDVDAPQDLARGARIALDVVIGTEERQTAFAPGRLRATWTKDGRRYFHYVTDEPIRNDYAFFSAMYAVRETQWIEPSTGRAIDIQIAHHPAHAWNAERMLKGVRASLERYTARLGPYPHGQIRFLEHPGDGVVLHAAPIHISFDETFALLNPEADERRIDLPFAVVAHEVAHQWWGNLLVPADVEGAGLLSETLAWDSALGVVEDTFGREHLARLLRMMREAYARPRSTATVPLLRADDQFLAYRKGPLAMYAAREYIGSARVDEALRQLLRTHGSGAVPLPTSRDLYRQLVAVTPDQLRNLLADLFERNTFWQLAAEEARTTRTETGEWQVTLDVRARKVVVDESGAEAEVPMDDPIEIGIFAAGADQPGGQPLYSRMHRIRSGKQRLTIIVPVEPGVAGIDPRNLLIDLDGDNNVTPIGAARSGR